MNRGRCIAVVTALVLGGCAGRPLHLDAASRMPEAARGADDRQVVVTLADAGVVSRGSAGASPRPYAGVGRYAGSPYAQRIAAELARDYDARRVAAWHIGSLELYCVVLEADSATERNRLVDRLRHDARVESAEEMHRFGTRAGTLLYNDPLFGLQTAVTDMDVPAAHALAHGRSVRVAVIDTGVDADHPDLAGRVRQSWNLVDDAGEAFLSDRHGTAVAGIIAAVSDNRIGIVGVAPEVEILALKACWQTSPGQPDACNTLTLAAALDVAIDQGARVVNLSLSGPSDRLLERLVNRALELGIVVVAPEDTRNAGAFPSGVPGVVIVSDAGEPGGGGRATLAAPGRDVLTLVPGGRYDYVSGASFATALVTGVVALMLEHQDLGPEEVATLLEESSRHPDAVLPGVVNACRALTRDPGFPGCGRSFRVGQIPDEPPQK
jgi:hypothetical protein